MVRFLVDMHCEGLQRPRVEGVVVERLARSQARASASRARAYRRHTRDTLRAGNYQQTDVR